MRYVMMPERTCIMTQESFRISNSGYGKLTAHYWRSTWTVPQCRFRDSSKTVPMCFIFISCGFPYFVSCSRSLRKESTAFGSVAQLVTIRVMECCGSVRPQSQ